MSCYALGAVVDPITLAALTFNGARVASALSKTEKITANTATDLRMLHKADPKEASWPSVVGQRLQVIPSPNLPKSLAVVEYESAEGSKYQILEKAVKTKSGEIKKTLTELPIDELTGAFDANYPGGKEFLESLLKETQDQVSFAFIDLNNLGLINHKFSGGMQAGNTYIKKVSQAINQATEGKAQMFKMGGDELALVIHETNPNKIQQLTEKIIKATHGPDVHALFKSEKILRAKNVRDGVEKASDFKALAPFLKEGVSIGVTQVSLGEDLQPVLLRAEKEAQNMKIKTKEALNIDATKYGGRPRDPQRRSDLTYVPSAPKPVAAPQSSIIYEQLPELSSAKVPVTLYRKNEVYRFGPISVVNYEDETGKAVTRYEKFVYTTANLEKTLVSREVVFNDRTGFIDGSQFGGRQFLNEFIKTATTATLAAEKNKSLLWIQTKNLGKVNYFKNGTQSGDQLLRATSEVIKREIGPQDIPFKLQGSEFAVALQNIPNNKLTALKVRLEKALKKDPAVNAVFDQQKRHLLEQLNQTNPHSASWGQIKNSINELKKIQADFYLQGFSLSKGDTLETVLEKLQKNHQLTNALGK